MDYSYCPYLIIDNFRQERCENTISNDEVEIDLFNNIKLCDGTIEDNIVRHQVLSDVKKLVKHLPDNQREVVGDALLSRP